MTDQQIIEIKKLLTGILQANLGNRITPELGNGILTSFEQQLITQGQQQGQQVGPNDAKLVKE